MEPITAAIVAVLPALVADTVKSAVKDAYEGLKEVFRRKWYKSRRQSVPLNRLGAAV